MQKKFKIPRKLKKQIPVGLYCYKGLSFEGGIYHIKPCVFYDRIQCKNKPENKQDEVDKEFPEEYVGWCKMLKCEIDDQCKSCGLKYWKK